MITIDKTSQSCALCEQLIGELRSWICNNCNIIFHEKCVRQNDNMNAWSCPRCKQLRVPPAPKSRQSSRITVHSNRSKTSAEIQLELLDEEANLLAKHREQREQHISEAEKSMRIQQEKELELLRKKQEIIKSLSDEASVRSEGSSLKNKEKPKPKAPDNKQQASGNNAEDIQNLPSGNVGIHSTLRAVDTSQQVTYYRLSNEALAARHVIDLKLPKFDGNPLEWQKFYSKFTSTTAQCNITPSENIDRLCAALSGRAYEAVKFKLLHPDNLDSVLSTLKRVFGRDDLVLNAQIQEMRLLKPRMDPLDSIVQYAVSVQNVSESMTNSGSRDHLYNPLLLQEMVEKLPSPIKLQWAEYRSEFSEINIEMFSSWLFEKAMKITDVMGTTPKFGVDSKNKSPNFLNFHGNQLRNDCLICDKSCKNIANCKTFADLNVSERWVKVRANNLCRSCLKSHNGRCRANLRCNVNNCTARHNSLLHQENSEYQSTVSKNSESINAHNHNSNEALFKYVPIILYGQNRIVSTYAFLDDGSSVTVIEQSLADELELEGQPEPLCLKWTSNESRVEDDSQRIEIDVSGKRSSKRYRLKARTIKSLDLPEQTLTKKRAANSLKDINNLSIDWYTNVKPRILIGLDNAKLTITNDVRLCAENDNLFAGLTKLGWVVYGATINDVSKNRDLFHICDCSVNSKLLEAVESYIVQDNMTVAPIVLKSKDDERALRIMESTTKYVNGRYETGLIWKYDDIQIPQSYSMAKRRLCCLERRLLKDPDMAKKLHREIESYISKGYAVKLDENDVKSRSSSWYLPIFLVKNPNKPEKIRLVWDAAAKTGNVSLNSLLLKGPDLLSSLPGILCRFRQRKIGITGDIAEMFHQIQIRRLDRPYQRFLYRQDPNMEPDVYEMSVMIFGASCSPTSAQYVKNINAEKFIHKFPRACDSIINNHYMDDMLDSVDEEEQAVQLAKEVRQIHAYGGFNIRSWVSNKRAVTEQLSCNEQNAQKNLDMSGNTEKVLGMWWNTEKDTITFSLKFNKGNRELLNGSLVPTKREVVCLRPTRFVESLYSLCKNSATGDMA